jgi:hypothetical protein
VSDGYALRPTSSHPSAIRRRLRTGITRIAKDGCSFLTASSQGARG